MALCIEEESGCGSDFEVTVVPGLDGQGGRNAAGREEEVWEGAAGCISEDGTASSIIRFASPMTMLQLRYFAFRPVSCGDHRLDNLSESKGLISKRGSRE